jgi:hypothetical protein
MDTHLWIIGQIVIDLIILFFLVATFRLYHKRHLSMEKFQVASQKWEGLLAEMRRITTSMEQNLGEKKRLTQDLLAELDRRMVEADRASVHLRDALLLWERRTAEPEAGELHDDSTRRSIKTLSAQGLDKQEIAKKLKVPVGEVDLMLKLQTRPE